MVKGILVSIVFIVSACVTVNIYFPAAAVERAADQIVKETWGRPGEPAKITPPRQSGNSWAPLRSASLGWIGVAYAQEADINVSNPAIRALRESIKKRSAQIRPYMDRGHVGIAQDGLLAIRSTDGLDLKARAEVKQLVEAENRDREALYVEIAKANGISMSDVPKIRAIFARSWIDQAQSGWWIQDSQGNWRRK